MRAAYPHRRQPRARADVRARARATTSACLTSRSRRCAAPINSRSLQDFLDIYYRGMSVLITEQDFFDLAWAYLERAHGRQCPPCRDVLRSAGPYQRAASPLKRSSTACIARCREAARHARHQRQPDHVLPAPSRRSRRGAHARCGACASRQDHRRRPRLPPSAAIPRASSSTCSAARATPAFICFAHAGEEGPPDYVWEALDVLGVDARRPRQPLARGRSAGRRGSRASACRSPSARCRTSGCAWSTTSPHHPLRRHDGEGPARDAQFGRSGLFRRLRERQLSRARRSIALRRKSSSRLRATALPPR